MQQSGWWNPQCLEFLAVAVRREAHACASVLGRIEPDRAKLWHDVRTIRHVLVGEVNCQPASLCLPGRWSC